MPRKRIHVSLDADSQNDEQLRRSYQVSLDWIFCTELLLDRYCTDYLHLGTGRGQWAVFDLPPNHMEGKLLAGTHRVNLVHMTVF